MTRKPQVLRGVKGVCRDTIVMGDPDRVELFSDHLDDHSVVYDKRGILVVNGSWKNHCITIASHGIGCPMASVIVEELRMLGAERFVRIGTAGSLSPEIDEGSVILADSASTMIYGCGTRMYFGDIIPAMSPDLELLTGVRERLLAKGLDVYMGPVFSSDAFHAESNITGRLASLGFISVDMETAIIYALSRLRGFRALSVLIVSNNLIRGTILKHTGELREPLTRVFEAVVEALTS